MKSGASELSSAVYAVVRSSGERTAGALAHALQEALPEAAHAVISETPLLRSLDCTLSDALIDTAEWLVVCDADVVVDPERLRSAVTVARTMPRDYFVLTPSVHDWLFGKVRPGGIRIYRVAHAATARSALHRVNDGRRPESSMISAMALDGYRSAVSSVAVGVHDRDQWLVDVYRKSYFFSHKHLPRLPGLVERWRESAGEHIDFRVALIGLADGLLGSDPGADVRAFDREGVVDRLAEFGIDELAPLSSEGTMEVLRRAREASAGPLSRRWLTEPMPGDLFGQWREYRRASTAWEALADMRALYDKLGYRSLLPNLLASRTPTGRTRRSGADDRLD